MKNKVFRIILSVLGIITGVYSIILSIAISTMSVGHYEDNKFYGGDAYTGIQNAAAQSANNIQDLSEILQAGFEALLLIIGLSLIIFSLYKLLVNNDNKTTSQVQENDTSIAVVSTPTSTNYINCPICGEIQFSSNIHCQNCGASFKSFEPKNKNVWHCEKCGNLISSDPCVHCGNKLS